jgi:CRP/FNR family transcriptional regulator, anaerobic regulatory protein
VKTTAVVGAPHGGGTQDATISYLHGVTERVATDALCRLQNALARVEDLKRLLASSQRESLAAQRQVDILTKANARLIARAVRRENASGAGRVSTWGLTYSLLSAGLDPEAMSGLERFVSMRRVPKGERLFGYGDLFEALYAIHTGSCKTVLLTRDGQEQVAGFHMSGEIVGMDGIGADVHECQVTALEDMEVSRIPFDRIERLTRFSDQFRHNLNKLLAQECSRMQTLMLVLGTMRADRRIAVFLLDLSQRFRARGFSSCEFMLRMTREEIGSYLGLQLETVSRQFARLQREGLIQVQGRIVELVDRNALNQLAVGDT